MLYHPVPSWAEQHKTSAYACNTLVMDASLGGIYQLVVYAILVLVGRG